MRASRASPRPRSPSSRSSSAGCCCWSRFGCGAAGLRRVSRQICPKWMGAIDSFTPVRSVGAFLLSAVNPKNRDHGGLCAVIAAKLVGDGITGLTR